MKNRKKLRLLFALFAVMLCMAAFPLTAFAGGGEETGEPPTETVTPEPEPEPNPFTPPGTGTVIDHATDADGKEFYTIMTPDENVFYLVIDHQREGDNVYFLDAVTEKDLLSLAEQSGDAVDDGETAIPETPPAQEPTPEPEPEPVPEPEPESSGNMGMLIVVALVVLGGGGAAYYFKIYRPKQERVGNGEEYEEYEVEDSAPPLGDDDAPPEDDGLPWYEDDGEDEAQNEAESGKDGEA